MQELSTCLDTKEQYNLWQMGEYYLEFQLPGQYPPRRISILRLQHPLCNHQDAILV